MNSNGDCLFATTVAMQIKKDYPTAHLTWAIGSYCRHIILNNPYVDEIWEIPLSNAQPQNVIDAWNFYLAESEAKMAKGHYNYIFNTQHSYGRIDNFLGITRASIFAGYPGKITVPLAPYINLTKQEVERVALFAEQHHLSSYKKVVLFECIANTGQTFIDDDFVNDFCERVGRRPEICLILSSNKTYSSVYPNIIDASVLSFRENAELTKYASLLIGVSSGISWLSTSTWAASIPKVMLVNRNTLFASMIFDHHYFNLNRENILEINDSGPEDLLSLISQDKFHVQEIDQKTYENTCFLEPFQFHLVRRNKRKLAALFLRAPSLRLKKRIIFLLTGMLFQKFKKT